MYLHFGIYCSVTCIFTQLKMGDSRFLYNTGTCQPHYMVPHQRRLYILHNKYMWDLWRATRHQDRFLSYYFNFPHQYHSTNAPYSSFIFTYIQFLPEGHWANPGNLSKRNPLLDSGEKWKQNIFTEFCLQHIKVWKLN